MNRSSAESQTAIATLLSNLLNQPLQPQQIHPLLAYLAALSAVLVGVTYADREVTDAEKQRLEKILAQFMPPDSSLALAVRSLRQGMRDSKIYAKPAELVTLTSLCSESEKLLLIGLGYELAIADGEMNPREQQYLRDIAQHF